MVTIACCLDVGLRLGLGLFRVWLAVLEFSRILEDNFEVLGLGLGLEACVLDSITTGW